MIRPLGINLTNGKQVLLNPISTDNRTFTTTSTTGTTVTVAFTSEDPKVEYEVCNSSGLNITNDSRLTRKWTGNSYQLTMIGGWPAGSWTLKPITSVVFTGGTGGVEDYDLLNNRPQINSVVLTSNKTSDDLSLVGNTRTINGYTLDEDISLSADDVGALPVVSGGTGGQVYGKTNSGYDWVTIDLSTLGGVPNTRTVNSKPLSSDITLTASDVNALPTIEGGTAGQVYSKTSSGYAWITIEGGTSTTDYTQLTNKPSINSITLVGNKTLSDLGIMAAVTGGTSGQYLKKTADGMEWSTITLDGYGLLGGTQTWTGENTFSQGVTSDIGFFSGTGTMVTPNNIATENLHVGTSYIGGTASSITGELTVGYLNAMYIDISYIHATDYIFFNIVGGTTQNIIDIRSGNDPVFTVERDGSVTVTGTLTSTEEPVCKGKKLTTLTSTEESSSSTIIENVTVPATSGVIYTYTLQGNDRISFGTVTSGYAPTFELWLTMPSDLKSFEWRTSIVWSNDDGEFLSTNNPPTFGGTSTIYRLAFQYDGTSWLGNLTSIRA